MDEALGRRLRAIRDEMRFTQKEMAAALGMSARGWQEIEKGSNPPSGETLLKIAALGFSPTWILLEQGPMRLADASSVDADLLERLDRVVQSCYREAGQVLPAGKSAGEAATMYNALPTMVRDLSDDREVELAVEQLAHRLKRRLAEAAAAPGTGKREAS